MFEALLVDEGPIQNRGGKNKNMKIWIPKAIAIVSENPHFEFFGKILQDLWFTLFRDSDPTLDPKRRQNFIVEQFIK